MAKISLRQLQQLIREAVYEEMGVPEVSGGIDVSAVTRGAGSGTRPAAGSSERKVDPQLQRALGELVAELNSAFETKDQDAIEEYTKQLFTFTARNANKLNESFRRRKLSRKR